MQDCAIPHEQSSTAPVVTICVGIACGIPHSLEQAASMLGLADRQLYSAKRAGRNRVALASLSTGVSS
ncbi:diguanylate cyclase [compost metagenome]